VPARPSRRLGADEPAAISGYDRLARASQTAASRGFARGGEDGAGTHRSVDRSFRPGVAIPTGGAASRPPYAESRPPCALWSRSGRRL